MMIAIATADSAALTPIEKRVMNMPSLPIGKSRRLNAACYKTKETNEKQQC